MVNFLSVEVGLLLISIAIAFFSYQGQLRTQMREAIEQLDDTHLSSTNKAKILLHGYSLLQHQTIVSFRILTVPQSGAQGSHVVEPLGRLPDGTDEGEENEREQFLNFLRGIGDDDDLQPVSKVEVNDYEMLITIDSIEPIAVRRVADEITNTFRENYYDNF